MRHVSSLGACLTAAAFALAVSLGSALAAGGGGDPAPGSPDPKPKPAPQQQNTQQPKPKKKPKTTDAGSHEQFVAGYHAARELVLAGRYDDAIAAFHALGRDEHPEVANYIGFASRKLGRYDDAKVWYEKALEADPKHVRTWQYYGMWHVEQGNMLKAKDHLEKIRLICGNADCKEYQDLQGAIDGSVTY